MLLAISISGWWVVIVPAAAYGAGLLSYHIVSSRISSLIGDVKKDIAEIKAKLSKI